MRYVVLVGGESVEVEVDGDHVTVAGRTLRASLEQIPRTPLRQLMLDGKPGTFSIESLGRGRWVLMQRGERVEVEVMDERTRHIRSLTGGGDRRKSSDVLKAPMPGLVVRVSAKLGEHVAPGTGLVVLEAMKMENELRAQAGGTIKAVRVAPGEAVEKGQVLVEFEQ